MVESIVIHAGAPKTATTYIQRGLYSNSAVLSEHGVYLPAAGRLELEPYAVSHHHLGWSLLYPKQYQGTRNPWPTLLAELETVKEPLVILSSEAFSRVASNGDGAALVVRAAKRICDDVTIVYFVRNQLSLMNSLYGQRVKSFRIVETFNGHTHSYRDRRLFDYEELLKPWYADETVRFTAVPFTGSRDVDPLAELLRVAGVTAELGALVSENDDVNSSLGPVGIEAARLLGAYLRGMYSDFDSEEMAAKRLYRLSSHRAHANGWCDESFWGWTPQTAAETVDYFAASNERFARDVWGTSWQIEMPVDREQRVARLLDLAPQVVERIQRFVFTLSNRFADLRAETPAR